MRKSVCNKASSTVRETEQSHKMLKILCSIRRPSIYLKYFGAISLVIFYFTFLFRESLHAYEINKGGSNLYKEEVSNNNSNNYSKKKMIQIQVFSVRKEILHISLLIQNFLIFVWFLDIRLQICNIIGFHSWNTHAIYSPWYMQVWSLNTPKSLNSKEKIIFEQWGLQSWNWFQLSDRCIICYYVTDNLAKLQLVFFKISKLDLSMVHKIK